MYLGDRFLYKYIDITATLQSKYSLRSSPVLLGETFTMYYYFVTMYQRDRLLCSKNQGCYFELGETGCLMYQKVGVFYQCIERTGCLMYQKVGVFYQCIERTGCLMYQKVGVYYQCIERTGCLMYQKVGVFYQFIERTGCLMYQKVGVFNQCIERTGCFVPRSKSILSSTKKDGQLCFRSQEYIIMYQHKQIAMYKEQGV